MNTNVIYFIAAIQIAMIIYHFYLLNSINKSIESGNMQLNLLNVNYQKFLQANGIEHSEIGQKVDVNQWGGKETKIAVINSKNDDVRPGN